MLKHTTNKNKKKGKRPHILENLAYLGNDFISTKIDLIQYHKTDFSSLSISSESDLQKKIKKDHINWFKIIGISNVDLTYNICKTFGVHRYDVKDLISDHQVTKIVSYENNTFILLSCPSMDENNSLVIDQIAFILTQDLIASIQEKNISIFDDAIIAIESNKVQIRDKGTDYLLYILLNCVYSYYNDCIVKIAEEISDIEDALLAKDTNNMDIMQFIQKKKKEYFGLKRMISPMREEYPNLLHNSNNLILQKNLIYFNDFDDRIRIASEDLESLHESITSLSDLYFNNNNLKMNNVIKKLSVVSTIFIPLTFMAGVWGMNFETMPELKWKFGYIFALGTMFIVAIAAILYLKKKKWF